MNMREFHNGLRVLLNIDKGEFDAALHAVGSAALLGEQEWPRFRSNPHMWFIRANDTLALGMIAMFTVGFLTGGGF